jgi:hypothetical protein
VRQGRKATGFNETAGLLKKLTGQPGKVTRFLFTMSVMRTSMRVLDLSRK